MVHLTVPSSSSGDSGQGQVRQDRHWRPIPRREAPLDRNGPFGARFDHLAIVTEKRAESRDMLVDVVHGAVVRDDREGKPGADALATLLEFNGTRLALLEPASNTSVTGRFLARRGPGLHHIAWRLDRLEAACAHLRKRNARLIPAHGGGWFLHPGDAYGVLIWLRPGAAERPAVHGGRGRIDHVTLAQHDREAALTFYRTLLGGTPEEAKLYGHMYGQELTMHGPQLGFISAVESASFVQTFLDSRGPGMHHVAFHLDDMPGAVDTALARGLRLVPARPPATRYEDVFLHPSNPTGTLIRFTKARERAAE